MVIDVSDVREGMEVLDSNGDTIGSVTAVRTTMIGGSGLDTGGVTDVDAGTTPNSYLEIGNMMLQSPEWSSAEIVAGTRCLPTPT